MVLWSERNWWNSTTRATWKKYFSFNRIQKFHPGSRKEEVTKKEMLDGPTYLLNLLCMLCASVQKTSVVLYTGFMVVHVRWVVGDEIPSYFTFLPFSCFCGEKKVGTVEKVSLLCHFCNIVNVVLLYTLEKKCPCKSSCKREKKKEKWRCSILSFFQVVLKERGRKKVEFILIFSRNDGICEVEWSVSGGVLTEWESSLERFSSLPSNFLHSQAK